MVVEELLADYLRFMGKEATSVADSSKITVDDIMFVLRKDKKKHDRVRELVAKRKQIENDKKAFSTSLGGVL